MDKAHVYRVNNNNAVTLERYEAFKRDMQQFNDIAGRLHFLSAPQFVHTHTGMELLPPSGMYKTALEELERLRIEFVKANYPEFL